MHGRRLATGPTHLARNGLRLRLMPTPARLLFVTEKFPYPVDDGGQIRTYNVLKELARELSVTLIGLAPPSPSDVEPIRELGVEVRVFARRRPRWKGPWYAAQALATREPYPLRKNFSRAMLDAIRAELASGSVAFVHFNHIDAVQYVEHLGELPQHVRTVFDTHNVLTTTYERLVETAPDPLRRAYCWLQWHKMHRYEPQVMRRVDRVLACSEVERKLLRTRGIDNVLVVPNGVDTQLFAPRPESASSPVADGRPAREGPCQLVFTGGMDYLPNQDGVRWFITEVVPELEKVLPDFKLTVVGKNPPHSLAALARAGRIEFTGRVDDVRPYTAAADVFVVPLRIGGGTRLKILEAQSMAIPVVSTRVGAEGIAVLDGRDILLADEPLEMANAIASLARSPERRRALAQAGRALVLERYDWHSVTAKLVEYYRAS